MPIPAHTDSWPCSHAVCCTVSTERNQCHYMDYYSFTDPRGMEGWVSLVGWPIVDSLPTKWSPVHQRSRAGCRPTTDVITTELHQFTLFHAALMLLFCNTSYFVIGTLHIFTDDEAGEQDTGIPQPRRWIFVHTKSVHTKLPHHRKKDKIFIWLRQYITPNLTKLCCTGLPLAKKINCQ